MKKRIYAITGIAGQLGSVIANKLVLKGEHVRGFYLSNEKNIIPGTEVFYGDVTKPATLEPFLAHDESEELILIHCAAIISISKRVSPKVYDVNVTGTENVVEMAKANGVKRMVHVSSVHAIPEGKKGDIIKETKDFDPRNVEGEYAKTKAAATHYVLQSETDDFEVVIVHPSGIIVPGSTAEGDFFGHFMRLYLQGELKTAVKGGYDFVDVRDVADGVISAVDNGRSGETYIFSGGYYTLKEISDHLAQLTDQKPIKRFLSPRFVKMFAWIAEAYYKIKKKTPLFTAYSIHSLQAPANFTHAKATEELGYNPRPILNTLIDVVNEFKAKSENATASKQTIKNKKKQN